MTLVIQRFPNGMHFIALDAAIVDAFKKEGHNRVICTINHSVSIHCALLVSKDLGNYIYVGNKVLKQLGLKAGDMIHATFLPDNTELQFEVPEEFIEVMATDPEAEAVFKKLTAGNKRGLIAFVAQVKSSYKRIERALLVAANLKAGRTSPRSQVKKTN